MEGEGGPARLERFLRQAAVAAEIVVPGAPTPTVETAAAALGVRPSQIVKSLLFQDGRGGSVLVVCRGDRRVDRRKLAEAGGLTQARLASPQQVLELTGYAAGGTPPVGHALPIRVILDRAVLTEPVVYGGGGSDETMLRIAPEEIARLAQAQIADVCRDEAEA